MYIVVNEHKQDMLHFLSNDLWIVNDTVTDTVAAASPTSKRNETMGPLADENEEFEEENENNDSLEDMWIAALSPECEQAPMGMVQPVGVSLNLYELEQCAVQTESNGFSDDATTDISQCHE